ncbi:MAG: acyl carrier protein [Berryella intestinalis]|uniref:Phosphopantetheine-binding protein n=1 Tax=Berryella intestinalis TaxID=1531429 RepID=A0A0A8B442_9ACTN|nr:acyl carrier protein [Berryella intestinalis]AJC12170.1 phosphopantetheine-binding protein [Berryella intestinalis]MDD7369972.1 acyl carrier protein [Berryella intestinalis]MDY3129418.1 acyl carrier protein [Berryella intestinalis]
MATLDVIKSTLAENLDIDEAAVTADATLDSLGIDSLDMVELICDIEEKLDIEFGEPEGIETIGDMVSYIDSL